MIFEVLSRLLRGSFLLVSILLLGAAAIVALYEGTDYLTRFTTNKAYAETVFGGLVPYDKVLDSQKHRGTLNRCVSVVVQLSDEAPEEPVIRTGRTWGTNFGGHWQQGPSPWLAADYGAQKGERTDSSDVMSVCTEMNWDEVLYMRIRAAAHDKTAWWSASFGNQLYSKKHSVAVLIYESPM